MKPTPAGEGNVAVRWARVAVDGLVKNGVEAIVISPGSRSTPLVAAASDHPRIDDISVVDERSAAFVALGIAAETRNPVALICTSGTATANYFPAICEAERAGVPLVVLTADRPPSLRESGASQSMRQVGLYGDKVLFSHDFALPTASPADLRYVGTMTSRAVGIARSERGPVHLNFPFQKPLEPQPTETRLDMPRIDPPVFSTTVVLPDPPSVTRVVSHLERATRPAIYVGSLPSDACAGPLFDVAERLGIPVFAEATSQLRMGPWAARTIPPDVILSDASVAETIRPDVLVRVGRPPLNWPSARWEASLDTHRIVVAPTWDRDPNHDATDYFVCDEHAFFDAIRKRLPANKRPSAWGRRLEELADQAQVHVASELAGEELFDASVAYRTVASLRAGEAIVVSSSMPLREFEAFSPRREEPIVVHCNRGLNGIDGIIATASGVARSRPRTTCLIGDVAFAHDIGSLAAARRLGVDLTLVVVDNAGGAIFDHLPVAGIQPMYDEHFVTAQSIDHQAICAGFGVAWEGPTTASELADALERARERPGCSVVTVRTNRDEAYRRRRAMFESFAPQES